MRAKPPKDKSMGDFIALKAPDRSPRLIEYFKSAKKPLYIFVKTTDIQQAMARGQSRRA